MTSIIVAGHGQFAKALVETSEMIAGKKTGVATVTLAPQDGIETLENKFKRVLATFSGNEILILVDLWGGSPFNAAAKFVATEGNHLALMAGVNLPLILEAYMIKDQPLAAVVKHLNQVAPDTIKQFQVSDQGEEGDDLE